MLARVIAAARPSRLLAILAFAVAMLFPRVVQAGLIDFIIEMNQGQKRSRTVSRLLRPLRRDTALRMCAYL